MPHVANLPLLLASDTAFFAIFGVFVVAIVVLSVVVVTWALRRDKAGRAAWRQRQLQRQLGSNEPTEGETSGPSGP